MAEYYPLLAKAVGSLPNSTPETRRVVYERARKALIGQLRTLHPPVPDEDIERESVELDRAVERLEGELASGGVPPQPAPAAAPPPAPKPAPPPILPPRPPARPASVLPETAAATAERKPFAPLRTKLPTPKTATPARDPAPARDPSAASDGTALAEPAAAATPPVAEPQAAVEPEQAAAQAAPIALDGDEPTETKPPGADNNGRVRLETQRPSAPQPARSEAGRRLWIIPVGVGVVVAVVAVAAWKLRDTRQNVARSKPVEHATQAESGKIAERVGGAAAPDTSPPPAEPSKPEAAAPPAETATKQAATPAPSNPELPVAHRAALLVEAPNEPNKVKTYLGTVVWKLNNVNDGPGDAVGLAVEADVDLPDDKMKAVVTFEKNTDASLPASHTIKVRFIMEAGSPTGNVQQISVPQLRQEDSPSGEALAGVTVPVVQNSFLVGLSPGNAETVNIKQLKDLQWIDVPMLLSNGKIAKLTFEKGDSGNRDLGEAVAAWDKS